MATSLRIQPVEDRRALKQFLLMPARLYAGDPNWVQPLLFERLEHLDPKKNPYFEHAEVAYWLALRGERPVGRISAQVDRLHLERHGDATGHFGFLEGEDDGEVFAALFEAAEAWLSARGMRRARGPFTLSINDETGLLVDGFDTPPYLMMGHVPRYYGGRVEEQGYRKARDLIAYAFDVAAPPPPRARRMLERLSKGAGLSFRPIDMRRFDQELQTIVDIFNDAWSDNWGFVPMTPAEVALHGQEPEADRARRVRLDRRGRRRAGGDDRDPAQPQRGDRRPGRPAAAVRLGEAAVAAQGAGHAQRAHAAHGRAQEVSGHARAARRWRSA